MLDLLILIFSSLILVKAASILVASLIKIAAHFKLTEFSVAFILMSFATTLPELLVGAASAFEKTPSLSLGNVLGSNIVDLTLVLGIVVLTSGGLWARSVIARQDGLYMAGIALAPVLLLLDKTLSRTDALLLLLLYIFYLQRLISQSHAFHEESNHVGKKEMLKNALSFALGFVLLLISSHAIVVSSKSLALMLKIPISLIGLFLIAVGTSLPELAFSLKAVQKEQGNLVLGDLVGSVVANSTLILAVTALIHPIHIESFSLIFSAVAFLLAILVIFEVAVYTDKKLDVYEGLVLLFTYIMFLFTEFGINFFLAR